MRISISISTTPTNMPQIMFAGNLDEHCAYVAELGYKGVDLFFPDPGSINIKEVKAVLDSHGLQTTMLAAAGDLMADGLFLNTQGRLTELLERSRKHIEWCAVLDAMPNLGFIRGAHGDHPGESLKLMAEGTAAYCDLAGSMGVQVLLEPICRYELNSVNTTEQALELWSLAGAPKNLFLLMDLFHMNIEEPSLTSAIFQADKRIGHVHFVENTRAVPGLGCLPLQEIVGDLRGVGYKGYLGIEAIPGNDPRDEARKGIEFTRSLLE